MTFEEIFTQIENIEGWMGKPDCEALYNYAKDVKGLIVEIGSYLGRSTKLIALSSPESKIISIDPIISPKKDSLINTMKGFNWSLINNKSQEIGKTWSSPIDFIHIDGDHTYESVKKDIELYSPFVLKGNYVLLHDYVVTGNPQEVIGKKDERYFNKEYGIIRALEETKYKYFDEVKIVSGFACCRKK